MQKLENEMLRILSSSDGEREIHNFLKKNLNLVISSFSRAWNARVCIPEFPLGNNYRADFVLLNANSGNWFATFIELESPKAKLYLKDGTPSKTLRIAQRQIEDWKDWIERNNSYLRQNFSIILRDKQIAAQCSVAGLHNLAETEITDPKTVIINYYHIVIGRRDSLSAEEQRRRSINSKYWGGPEIATYDRIIERAKAWDIGMEEIAKARND